MSDDVLFDELTDEPNEAEAAAECGEVPADLIQLSVDLESTGMTPDEFKKSFGKKKGKKK